MNKRQKECIQAQLDSEKAVLEQLEKHYTRALNDIDKKIRILLSDELTQSRIYRLEYQKALKEQVKGVLEKLHSDEYTTIQQFLSASYTDAFVGTAYDLFGQGVPIIMPIDPEEAVKAVLTDSKINGSLYESLGVDVNKLKKTISSEISRGIAGGMSYNEIARNISSTAKAPMARAKTIVQTESHRIQQAAKHNARVTAKSKGADITKQWNSTLDGGTRDTHRKLDGQIRELDEPFEVGGMKAMYPGDFGDPAEDCNCRCEALQRAKWALGEAELETLKERAKYFGLDKTKDFESFKKAYLDSNKKLQSYDSNPYVINEDDLPPAIYQFRNYEDFRTAAEEWRKTHTGDLYDSYVQNSVWSTSGLTDEQIERIKRIDATVAKLQSDYPLNPASAKQLYIGSYENMGTYLNDIQRSRMDDSGLAQAQFWFNPDDRIAVIGFEHVGIRGTLADDLLIREKKIKNGEVLSTVLDNSPEGIAIHEWGHGFTQYITDEMIYDNPAAHEYWDWYRTLSKDDIINGISSYAATNRGEFEAECFAELLTGNPRPIAKRFGEYLDRCQKDALKRLEKYGEDAINSGTAGVIEYTQSLAIKRDTSSIKTVILSKDEYAHVMSEIATNLSKTQAQQRVVSKAIGDHVYTFENNGFGNYRIIGKKPIDEDVAGWWND